MLFAEPKSIPNLLIELKSVNLEYKYNAISNIKKNKVTKNPLLYFFNFDMYIYLTKTTFFTSEKSPLLILIKYVPDD